MEMRIGETEKEETVIAEKIEIEKKEIRITNNIREIITKERKMMGVPKLRLMKTRGVNINNIKL